jgi:hypothetical protein
MINSKISAALATQLNTLDLPTHWENSKFKPTAGVLYLSESLLSGETIAVGVSSASSDEFGGVYQVLVYAPLDNNKGPARSAADAVSAAFQRGDRLAFDGITVTIQRTTQDPAFISGDRFVIPVSITYRAYL